MSDASPVIQYFLTLQFFLPLLIAIALIPILRRPALKFKLIDHPHGRKMHKEAVPLVGGPAIFIASAISLNIWGIPPQFEGMVFAATGLFLIGLADDRYDISAKFRLLCQAALVTGALWWDNNWISDIILSDSLTLNLGVFKYLISVVAVLGIMNAINMLDGLDGLSAGVVLIILGFIIGVSITSGASGISLVSIIVFGAVLGFWAFNYRFEWREKASVFMGDSGTTVLGFILPFLAIKLSIVSPTYAPNTLLLWLFAIPIWDICAVVIKRLRDGVSPLQARRDHIHHVLMNAGVSVRQSLHLIYLLTTTTISFGISLQLFNLSKIEAYIAFFVFMLIYLGRVGSLSKVQNKLIEPETTQQESSYISDDNKIIDLAKRTKTLS